MKFAAIDIGSNAIRLLFTKAFENGKETFFKKDALFRVPIRLGDDVFERQEVSDEKAQSLIEAMIAFKHLIRAYQPLDFRAYATSAMREAKNAPEMVEEIKKKSGIDVEIIDGRREAEILYSNRYSEKLNSKKSYLLIDVGGGSTAVTLISKNKVVKSRSFDLGTVRIIKGCEAKSEWDALKKWIRTNTEDYKPVFGIGSGGNINKIFRFSRRKEGKPLSIRKLEKIYVKLNSYSFEDRIRILQLRPDRADVIIPAIKIFLRIMNWGDIKKLYVPQFGLADGIIHVLYDRYKRVSC